MSDGGRHWEFLVEEPSMEATLRCLLPGILGGSSFDVHPYLCKDDLLSKLPFRLQGYAKWIPAGWRIMVLVDRDDQNCEALKDGMEAAALSAGLVTRKAARGGDHVVVTRLAIEELEAWFFGDWEAVRKAYPRAPVGVERRAGFRDPDAIRGGTWEALERILRKVGYFKMGLRKVEAAREIAAQMDVLANRSGSFRAFRAALQDP